MSAPPAPAWRITLGDVAIITLGQLAISGAAWAFGPSAISDDDYARVVIAQQFVEAPSLDPSGTSWLPFPFLLVGTWMLLTQATLGVAQMTAVITSAGAAFLLYCAARQLGSSRGWALGGALVAAALPYAARLSIATVPEYLTAALIVYAATTLNARGGRVQMAGGFALLIACASRYEAWPAAAVFALVHLARARDPSGRRCNLGAALLALAFPLVWVAHGVLNHGNAFFFIQRVTDYKEALDGGGANTWGSALVYLKGALLCEPEVTFAALALVAFVLVTRASATWRPLLLPWILPGAMLLVLTASALGNGAPTHHAERALLSIWLLLALTGAHILELLREKRALGFSVAAGGVIFGGALRWGGAFEIEAFVDRSAEIHFAKNALAPLPPDENIALALPDYGYLAMMAAAGSPRRFTVLDRHDPRDQETSGGALALFLKEGGCLFVVHANDAPGDSQVLHESLQPFELRRGPECLVRGQRPLRRTK